VVIVGELAQGSSVTLERVNSQGSILTSLGVLTEDPLNGNSGSQERLYRGKTTIFEDFPGSVNLRVSVMFAGQTTPTYSSLAAVNVAVLVDVEVAVAVGVKVGV